MAIAALERRGSVVQLFAGDLTFFGSLEVQC
jgi:hypothetical protein